MKVKLKTNSYQNRIIIGFIRILIALISIGFFLYFFGTEILHLKYLEKVKEKVELNEKFEKKISLLNTERSAALRWAIAPPDDTVLKEEYEILVEKVEADLKEVETWTVELPEEHTVHLRELFGIYDVLSKTVLSGNYSKVEFFNFYADILVPFSIFWGEKCETNDYRANAYVYTDNLWISYVSFFTLRRDLIIGISYLNLTSEEKYALIGLYYKVKSFEDYFYQYTIRYYSLSQLQIWKDLFALPETIEIVELLDNITLNFENNLTLDIEISEFEEMIEELLDVYETVDSYETFDPNEGVYERFAISLIGVLFELVTAISLIWMAVPITKLLIAFHTTSPSSKPNNDTELSKTSSV